MNQTIEQRMQSIEDQLKEIRKELEESLARYNKQYDPEQDPRTATGHSLRHLAQRAGVLFGYHDTDEQVRSALIGDKS